jgi:transcriptional regulator with XRE-family HTH domain
MINSDDFIKRLEFIIEYYSLSASSLADKIGVQRSSLSHLLSGRNKPSLDFILKILEVFPEVDLYWILNGKGSFPKNEAQKISIAPTPITEIKFEENVFEETKKQETGNPISLKKISNIQDTITSSNKDKIEKIVIFYTNGKFVEYNP